MYARRLRAIDPDTRGPTRAAARRRSHGSHCAARAPAARCAAAPPTLASRAAPGRRHRPQRATRHRRAPAARLQGRVRVRVRVRGRGRVRVGVQRGEMGDVAGGPSCGTAKEGGHFDPAGAPAATEEGSAPATELAAPMTRRSMPQASPRPRLRPANEPAGRPWHPGHASLGHAGLAFRQLAAPGRAAAAEAVASARAPKSMASWLGAPKSMASCSMCGRGGRRAATRADN
eukprot:scaffold61570_cov37-Phaeocystis_antarctica.AAC.1